MTKLTKIWKLTDTSTGFEMATFLRKKLEPFECSTTIIEEQYLITKEQLEEVYKAGFGYKVKPASDYLKELGVDE